jgi:AraC family transcriptional regulator of adaptative response/methylated-DNA-[protein]-cysteine methyltransferase
MGKMLFLKGQHTRRKKYGWLFTVKIYVNDKRSMPAEIKLHLNGTAFQLKVWENLLKIPVGSLSTYGKIAGEMGKPSASRAIGTAIGKNPVAVLIPCHRVVQSSGKIGGFRWGSKRKSAIIAWEATKIKE